MELMTTHSRSRVYSLDILRGMVMIIMALDHVRDYFHFDAFLHDPLDVHTTSPFLYFTRWITHFCAPVFVLLAGTSARLQSHKKTKKELSLFLIKRGLWLILIEITVVTFAWTFNPAFNVVILQVIWAIGFSMVMLGLFIWLPIEIIFFIGMVIVLFHNVLDFTPAMKGNAPAVIGLLFKGNFSIIPFASNHAFLVIYAGVPWMGLMLLGYCLGAWYAPSFDSARRKKLLIWTGIGLLVFFTIIRWTNLYGDPHPWSAQPTVLYSFLSFMNVTKYPPSLLYMCATIGPALIFLAFIENVNNRFSQAISIYGRVPFFYYIIHLYLVHAGSMVAYLSRGHTFSQGVTLNKANPFLFSAPGEGYHLWMVYLVWIAIVLILYPCCKWFNHLKNRKRVWWMSYL